MSKNVLIPIEVLEDVYSLVQRLKAYSVDNNTQQLTRRLERFTVSKIHALNKRTAFSEYKSAPPGVLREIARRDYLDVAGIHKDFITPDETNGF